ncbi:MAG: hypothetical protein OHK0039_05620 [Bacteroidia bacterium]
MKLLGRIIVFLFKAIFYTIGGLFVLVLVVGLLANFMDDDTPAEPSVPEAPRFEVIVPTGEGAPGVRHTRSWTDYAQRRYEGQYVVADQAFAVSQAYRNDLQHTYNQGEAFERFYRDNEDLFRANERIFLWSYIYEALLAHDRPLLTGMVAMFDSIYQAAQPDRIRFAQLIVCHVQHLPYVLVHSESCAYQTNQDPGCRQFSCRWHQQQGACKPGMAFGLQAPAEFAYNLEGDCDTRVLLLLSLLRHYGYHARMVWSESYGHAVLGIDLPGSGNLYLQSEGRKYYLWETTATGWQHGQIEPLYRDLRGWHLLRTFEGGR